LIVRGESRLGSAGVVNPDTDEVVTGTNTNWLLASPAELTPGVVLGTVNGKIEPTIRSFRLDQGQWGIGFDVQLSLAATVLDPKGLYFATGA
jgi:hypothetical protein